MCVFEEEKSKDENEVEDTEEEGEHREKEEQPEKGDNDEEKAETDEADVKDGNHFFVCKSRSPNRRANKFCRTILGEASALTENVGKTENAEICVEEQAAVRFKR